MTTPMGVVSEGGYWAQLPEWVLYADISDRAVRLYGVLVRHADKDDGSCKVYRTTLARKLRDCSVSSVDRALSELQEIHAVTIQKQRRQGSKECDASVYFVHKLSPTEIEAAMARGVAAPVTPPSRTSDATGGRTSDAENQSHLQPEKEADEPSAPSSRDAVDEHAEGIKAQASEIARSYLKWVTEQTGHGPSKKWGAIFGLAKAALEAGFSRKEITLGLARLWKENRPFNTDVLWGVMEGREGATRRQPPQARGVNAGHADPDDIARELADRNMAADRDRRANETPGDDQDA